MKIRSKSDKLQFVVRSYGCVWDDFLNVRQTSVCRPVVRSSGMTSECPTNFSLPSGRTLVWDDFLNVRQTSVCRPVVRLRLG